VFVSFGSGSVAMTVSCEYEWAFGFHRKERISWPTEVWKTWTVEEIGSNESLFHTHNINPRDLSDVSGLYILWSTRRQKVHYRSEMNLACVHSKSCQCATSPHQHQATRWMHCSLTSGLQVQAI
jgi:hypothetical protein